MRWGLLIVVLILISACADGNVSQEKYIEVLEHKHMFYSESLHTGEEATLVLTAVDPENRLIPGKDMQGQVTFMKLKADIYYANASETSPGNYSFTWTPAMEGPHQVQWVYKVNKTIIKPTFNINVAKGHETHDLVRCDDEHCDLPVHWHAYLNISVCGEEVLLEYEVGDMNRQHTHTDTNRIHFHNMIQTDSDRTEVVDSGKFVLGQLFDQYDIAFNSTCFGDHCNGDLCKGKPGKLKMTVNGEPNNEFYSYEWQDKEKIRIVFG